MNLIKMRARQYTLIRISLGFMFLWDSGEKSAG